MFHELLAATNSMGLERFFLFPGTKSVLREGWCSQEGRKEEEGKKKEARFSPKADNNNFQEKENQKGLPSSKVLLTTTDKA